MSKREGMWPGGEQLALGNQRFPVWIRLVPMRRSEFSAVIIRVMSKCL